MKKVSRMVLSMVLCVGLLFSYPAVKAHAANNTVQIGYTIEASTVVIDKGTTGTTTADPVKTVPVQTGDEFDLQKCFATLVVLTLSLGLLLLLKRQDSEEEEPMQ